MTDRLYRHVKEITLTYQSSTLMQLAIEAALQGDNQFIERTVLEGLNTRYSNVCYMGMFIQRVLAIQKRSSITVGDFKQNGDELYQVHCVVQVECIVIQPQCVFCCSVVETNQSQNNLKRLIIGKGLDQLGMVRVYINLDTSSKEHQNITITNGMVLPCIAVSVKYTDGMISVFATPVTPFTFSYHFAFNTSQSLEEYAPYIEQYSQLIAATRQQIKQVPKEVIAKVCSLLVKDLKEKDKELLAIITGKSGAPIENVCQTLPANVHLSAVDCLLGVVRESAKSAKEPETHESSGLLLVQMIIKVCRLMTLVAQLTQRYQTVKELNILQSYMTLPGNEVI